MPSVQTTSGATAFVKFTSDTTIHRTGYAASCPNGGSPRGFCCNNFSGVPSVIDGSCTSCTGDQPADCAEATCAAGYSGYHRGVCCNNFQGVTSVVDGSCAACDGGSVEDCSAATCAAGFSTFIGTGGIASGGGSTNTGAGVCSRIQCDYSSWDAMQANGWTQVGLGVAYCNRNAISLFFDFSIENEERLENRP